MGFLMMVVMVYWRFVGWGRGCFREKEVFMGFLKGGGKEVFIERGIWVDVDGIWKYRVCFSLNYRLKNMWKN